MLAGSKSRGQQGITVATDTEAETLKRLLDANGQSFDVAQFSLLSNEARVPTVAEVVQEHIDLLIRPSSGTTRTYQVMLDLHIRNVIGHIPVNKLLHTMREARVRNFAARQLQGISPQTPVRLRKAIYESRAGDDDGNGP